LLNYTGRISQTSNEGSTREQTLQADYVQPIGKQTLEVGLKSNFRYNTSDYFYQNQDPETGAFVLDPRMSNNFDYRQDIHAAYASFSLQMQNWGLRIGGRLEETFVEANFSSSDTTARQHYQNLIPNLNLSRKLKGSSSVRVSYAQRLERPSLFHINPYVNLTDPRNISYGNPALDPAINHVVNLAFSTYKQGTSINAGLSHQFTNNSIQYLTTLGEDTVARSTFANIGRRQTYGLTLGGNTTLFKKLNLNINTSANYVDLQSTRQGQPQQNTGITWNASGNVSYRLYNTWRLSSNVGYTSPQVLLQGKSASFVSNNFSVNKELMKNNKASLSVSIRNPFQKYRRFLSEVNDPAFHQWQESYSVIRQYNATFNYRFGKVHTGGPRKKRTHQEQD
jgi:outer membrane receptor protein involved in Fe transport